VVDGVFDSLQGGVAFHAATRLDEAAIPQVHANVRKRILPAFVARGHIEACDVKDMAERATSSSNGGGFSVDAGVLIEAADRAGLERLLRYCARPPFAMHRLKQRGADLVYRCGNGHARPMQPGDRPRGPPMHMLILLSLALLLGSPVAAQERIARVGELMWRDSGPYYDTTHSAFVAGLGKQGFVEGRNLLLLQRSADSDPARFKLLARELAATKVDEFFAPASTMATGAWYADRSTPIVIANILDPVKLEFVKSLVRPGTRVTGVTTMNKELTAKRLQMLLQAVPGIQRIGVLIDDAIRDSCKQGVEAMDAAARRLGVTLNYVHVRVLDDVEPAFRKFVEGRARAVLMTLTSTRQGLESEYAQAALKYRLPVMPDAGYAVPLGALLSYGPDLGDVFRRAGNYVGRVLKGEKPAEMPMGEPGRFILSLNLKTARALGLTLPASVMVLADEVIE